MNSKKIFDAYNLLLESDDIERLKKIIVRYELFKKSLKIPGDIIECGVFKGTGHIFWLKLLEIFDHNSLKREHLLCYTKCKDRNVLSRFLYFVLMCSCQNTY